MPDRGLLSRFLFFGRIVRIPGLHTHFFGMEDEMDNTQEKIGRVIEVRKNSFVLDCREREIPARLKGSFYDQTTETWPVVGDWVRFLDNPEGDSLILSVCGRKSFLQRLDTAKTGAIQAMAANVDYCFIVTALNGDYSYNRIARYASVALQGGAVPVLILTKADLCQDAERYLREAETISDKLQAHAVSALHGTGLEALREYFVPGTTICLMGSSGVGKSTLINALAGEEIMKTGDVRQRDAKGRHTTTHRQLIRLKNGVSLIDTPGMREMGMAETGDGIDDAFSDILELASRCRFRNCSHRSEPGCAVKAALTSGELSRERLRLYESLAAENADHSARKKQISQLARAYQKNKNRTG